LLAKKALDLTRVGSAQRLTIKWFREEIVIMDTNLNINRSAPVTAAGEITVAANADVVWDVLAAIDRWSDWNPDIKVASLQGPLAVGSKFSWKAGPGTIYSTILQLNRPQIMAWTGSTLGIKAIHVWRLESIGEKTRVITEESWEGLLLRILIGPFKRMLKRSIDSGLIYLKAEAERRANS
jgi:hypothetical protein